MKGRASLGMRAAMSVLGALIALSAMVALGLLAAGMPLCGPRGCGHASVLARKDFNDSASLQGLVWKCHTAFRLGRDATTHRGYLEAVTYKEEPGMELPWLNGDWRPYRNLCLEASVPGKAAAFRLTLWDGEGEYGPENRLHWDFDLDSDWRRHCVDIDKTRATPSGRRLDLARIRRVVLFMNGTNDGRRPFRFRLASVEVSP